MTQTNASFPRNHSLDALRAWMMLLGIFIHAACAHTNIPDAWWFRDPQTSVWVDSAILFIHLFRMPVFFVMAGFFAALLYYRRGWRGMFENRAMRVGLPFALGILFLSPILKPMGAFAHFASRRPDAWQATWSYMLSGRWLGRIEPMHLWFLEYLILLYGLALIVVPVMNRIPLGGAFRRVMLSGLAPVVFAVPTFLVLCVMEWGLLDTPHSFVPVPRIAGAYAIFFFFGWALFCHRDLLESFRSNAVSYVFSACLLSAANIAIVVRHLAIQPARSTTLFVATAATGALVVWFMIFGLTGLVLRYAGQPSARTRYLSDAAYWLYLFHPPVIVLAQFAVWGMNWHWTLKLIFVHVVSVPVLLWTYRHWVRSTWVGALLNGRRYEKQAHPATPDQAISASLFSPERSAVLSALDLDGTTGSLCSSATPDLCSIGRA